MFVVLLDICPLDMKLVETEVNQLVDFLTTQNCQVEATQGFWHLAPSVLYEETG